MFKAMLPGLAAMLAVGSVQGFKVDRDDHAPAPSYSTPTSSYAAPSYSAEPASTFIEPSYAAPSPTDSYGAPSYNGAGGDGVDLTPIAIAILGVTGLSLLFPSYLTLSSVRRRRRNAANNDDDDVVPGKGRVLSTNYILLGHG